MLVDHGHGVAEPSLRRLLILLHFQGLMRLIWIFKFTKSYFSTIGAISSIFVGGIPLTTLIRQRLISIPHRLRLAAHSHRHVSILTRARRLLTTTHILIRIVPGGSFTFTLLHYFKFEYYK